MSEFNVRKDTDWRQWARCLECKWHETGGEARSGAWAHADETGHQTHFEETQTVEFHRYRMLARLSEAQTDGR